MNNMKKIVFCNNSVTGGHYALQNLKSKVPFCNPMRECKSIKLYKEDIVADIGAYVGEYSIYASNQGVKKVLSYEATPETFNVLKMNKTDNMHIYNKAVVGDNSKEIELYLSKGIGATNSIAKKGMKAGYIKVPAIKYEEALQDATVVKIDVEGAEYGYNIIQPQLRAIILEFHPLTKKDWMQMAYNIMNKIKSHGFKPIIEPTFKSGWDLNSSWVR